MWAFVDFVAHLPAVCWQRPEAARCCPLLAGCGWYKGIPIKGVFMYLFAVVSRPRVPFIFQGSKP